jgi:tetratricopeptide (TPR) repeat protein
VKRPRTAILLAVLAALACLQGCAPSRYRDDDDEEPDRSPQDMSAVYREAVEDNSRDAVLHVDRMLSTALIRHDWQDAVSLATRASTLVNIFLAGTSGERDALSLFGREKDKPFKGEPHERAMVDYYLGVLRFREKDYEGALAAFRSAMQKDRGSFLMPVEHDRAKKRGDNVDRYLYDDDYAVLHILAAKCYQLLEEPDEAAKSLARAAEVAPRMKPLLDEVMDPATNVLVLVEAGGAPQKRLSGPQGSVLAYVPGPRTEVDDVSFGGGPISFGMLDDLYYQATTLGGREVDNLNRTKAERQEILHMAGFATAMAGTMIAIAAANSHNRNLEAAGWIGLAVGIGTMIFAAAAIDPSADLRAWGTLPAQIYLAAGRAEPGGKAGLSVRARGADGPQDWVDVPVDEGVNLYPVRLGPGLRGGAWTPPPPPAPQPQP